MLWPIVLPLKITFWILVAAVLTLTAAAPSLKWNRGKTFRIAMLLAFAGFVPSCVGIMSILDSHRFGTFEYASFSDVKDFRIERYLPTQAKDITPCPPGMG